LKKIIKLTGQQAREAACRYVHDAPEGWVVTIQEETRNLEQNALLWPLLDDLAEQVDWYGTKLTAEEWKDVMTASLLKQKAVPGIDGGFVVCGQSTSRMSKSLFSELIELIYSFGADKGVTFRTEVV